MNIFYLDSDPRICASYHCDKHVVKMILESAQLLCTAINEIAGEQITPYKSTHINHPCSVWIRESYKNWSYVFRLMLELEKEWQYRYQHERWHKSVTDLCEASIVSLAFKHLSYDKPFTPPALAMPLTYQIPNDPIASYRNYYVNAKNHLHTWTRREPPSWLADYQ